jgi:ubiquitin conjugation factor E4 B
MSDDTELIQVLASLPLNEGRTVLDYLGSCWKRIREVGRGLATISARVQQDEDKKELEKRSALVDELRALVLRYVELSLGETEMFPQPAG